MNSILAKEWLKAANYDFILLEEIKSNENLTTIIAFHSQQTIEKVLKALLCFDNADVPKVYSLNKLFKLNEHHIKTIDNKIVNKLDKLYIDSRYPGDMGLLPYGKPTLEDAKEFYDFAYMIFDKVCDILDIDKSEITDAK
jgi:HEPN domain-containing protein